MTVPMTYVTQALRDAGASSETLAGRVEERVLALLERKGARNQGTAVTARDIFRQSDAAATEGCDQ